VRGAAAALGLREALAVMVRGLGFVWRVGVVRAVKGLAFRRGTCSNARNAEQGEKTATFFF
jgi:hypothetical protein